MHCHFISEATSQKQQILFELPIGRMRIPDGWVPDS
jgi:hypothetical protein